jgi:hypothetical protein
MALRNYMKALISSKQNKIFKSVTVCRNFNKIAFHIKKRLPLWSSGQSSWLQIQRSGFDSRYYEIFLEIVVLEWGSLRLLSATEELLGRKQ